MIYLLDVDDSGENKKERKKQILVPHVTRQAILRK
jgi:hypothetical protein